MELTKQEKLSEIQKRRQEEASVPITIGAIGQQLVHERLKNAQNRTQDQLMIKTLGQEIVKAKLEIANLKGGTTQ